MDILALVNEKLFLGQEFLTWLWYLSEKEDKLVIPGGRRVQILLGDRLAMCPAQGQDGTSVTVRGQETFLAEARQALKRGKLVELMRLGLVVDGEEFWCTLRAHDLAMGSLRLPPAGGSQEPGQGREGVMLERLYLAEMALRALEGLFSIFLAGRLADEKGGELWASVRIWAGGE
jgi:recombination associated protein RdgC